MGKPAIWERFELHNKDDGRRSGDLTATLSTALNGPETKTATEDSDLLPQAIQDLAGRNETHVFYILVVTDRTFVRLRDL